MAHHVDEFTSGNKSAKRSTFKPISYKVTLKW